MQTARPSSSQDPVMQSWDGSGSHMERYLNNLPDIRESLDYADGQHYNPNIMSTWNAPSAGGGVQAMNTSGGAPTGEGFGALHCRLGRVC